MVRTLPVPVLRYFGNPGTHKDDDAGRRDSAIRILPLNSGFLRVSLKTRHGGSASYGAGERYKKMRKTHVRTLPIFALAVAFGVAGCHKNPAQDQSQNAAQVTDDGQDPAMQANLAPANGTTTANTPAQTQAAQYPTQAPAQQGAPAQESAPPPPPDQTASTASPEYGTAPSDQSYDYNAVDQRAIRTRHSPSNTRLRRPRRCPSISSRNARVTTICGLRATGDTRRQAITGCRVCG